MRRLSLYWSNICVLSKVESVILNRLSALLRERGIELIVSRFGLGQKYRLSDYVMKDRTIPDIIVSTDLEIYENKAIFNHLGPNLRDLSSMAEFKDDRFAPSLMRDGRMLPFLSIPLVFHSNSIQGPLSLESVAKDGLSFAFGGVSNSAGRTIVKLIWDHYGIESAENLFRNSLVTPMPIGAYTASKNNQKDISISPLLFPLSGNIGHIYAPEEGAVAIPSYISISSEIDEETAALFLSLILSRDVTDYYVNSHLYCPIKDSAENRWLNEHCDRFFTIRECWFESTSSEEFDAFYNKMMERAGALISGEYA